MLHLILAEAELELVPVPARAGTDIPVLDAYFHRELADALPDGRRRGRPDIVHQALSLCQGSRLNRAGMLRTYVHTRDDMVIEVEASARVPPNQVEFLMLMGRLLDGRDVDGYKAIGMTLRSLLDRLDVPVVAMSPDGEDVQLAGVMSEHEDLAVVVGAFPCGDYRGPVYELADVAISLGKELLTVPAVVSEVLCAASKIHRPR
jgi:rRNA small subunit pseudouridine methyltransferase Nep1